MQFSGQVKEKPPAAKSTATRRSTRSDASADCGFELKRSSFALVA